jgi:hypothetical protein
MGEPTKLIALYSPRPQCGKSSIAKRLWRSHGYTVVPFARLLKLMSIPLAEALGYRSLEDLEKEAPIPGLPTDGPNGPITPRLIWRTLGTEYGRLQLHTDIWVILWRLGVERMLEQGKAVVVDDLRFPNEHQAVTAMGGLTVKITRPQAPPVTGEHASDGALEQHNFHRELINASDNELDLDVIADGLAFSRLGSAAPR